jgi:hypothetical protein
MEIVYDEVVVPVTFPKLEGNSVVDLIGGYDSMPVSVLVVSFAVCVERETVMKVREDGQDVMLLGTVDVGH